MGKPSQAKVRSKAGAKKRVMVSKPGQNFVIQFKQVNSNMVESIELSEPPPVEADGNEVVCSITYEPIGSLDAYVPFAPPGLPPLSGHPSLTCGKLSCGHKFHASAILVHYMRNGMRCPLCRAGQDALPCSESFPKNEPWFQTTAANIAADIAVEMETHRQEDAETARLMMLDQVEVMVR